MYIKNMHIELTNYSNQSGFPEDKVQKSSNPECHAIVKT
jgi:hypothetical protein